MVARNTPCPVLGTGASAVGRRIHEGMGRGAAAYDKNGCERTRKRDHDEQTDHRPLERRPLQKDTVAARCQALGDPPPDPLGFSALMPIPKVGKKEGGIKPPPSVLAPGSALG